jgi:hypothetical protein
VIGRQIRDRNHSPNINNLIQYSEGNEENGTQFWTPTKQR